MRAGDLEHDLSKTNAWWRPARGRRWEDDDHDLRIAAAAPFVYHPEPLRGLQPGGLYVLSGPRRVGKSVEIKRAISVTIESGLAAGRVVHAACNGWKARDLNTLLQVLDDLAPAEDGARSVFLDEITAIDDDWVGQIAWLRDNTSLHDDCVVLSGSSAERLEQARRDLAGRRGGVGDDSTRTLLPMGFRSFCRVTGLDLPDLPVVHPRDMLGSVARSAVQELRRFLAEVTAAWERYLQIGGLPRAVRDWIEDRRISEDFIGAVWDAIHGDALQTGDWTAAQSQELLEALAVRLDSPVNKSDVRRDLGGMHHGVLERRLNRLQQAFVAWPCYRADGNRPDVDAQEKWYFVDPMHARLAHLRRETTVRPPDFTQLTEQQLAVALLRAQEREQPGRWLDADTLLYYRSATRKEVDFVGGWLAQLPYESKYTSGAWWGDAQTAIAAFGAVVFATRNRLEQRDNALAAPAGFLGYLIDEAVPLAARL